MTRTQGTQSADDPAIPPPPDQSKTRLDSTRRVLRWSILTDVLLASSLPVTFAAGRFGVSWWYLGGYAVIFVGLVIARTRYARELAREVELAYALPRPIRFPGPWMGAALADAAPKINAAMRDAMNGLANGTVRIVPDHKAPDVEVLVPRRGWTAAFMGGVLDETEQVLQSDPSGVPPLVHVHTERTGPALLRASHQLEILTHYKLVDLDPKRRRANYEVQHGSFVVTIERYEQLRRAVQGAKDA